MGDNPYHDQHIKEFTECVDEAMQEIQLHYDAIFLKQNEVIASLLQRVEKLEQNMPTRRNPFEVDIVATKESLEKLKRTIMGIFR